MGENDVKQKPPTQKERNVAALQEAVISLAEYIAELKAVKTKERNRRRIVVAGTAAFSKTQKTFRTISFPT